MSKKILFVKETDIDNYAPDITDKIQRAKLIKLANEAHIKSPNYTKLDCIGIALNKFFSNS